MKLYIVDNIFNMVRNSICVVAVMYTNDRYIERRYKN